jgi:hypothetical protein
MTQAVALHLGFAGSRALFPSDWPAERRAAAHARLVELLALEIGQLKSRLGLSGKGHGEDETGHFWVGVSQVAVGADAVFADACVRLGIPLRVFLPQTRDEYLRAQGTQGPDFDEDERAAALARLEHPNVIQQRVVSHSSDRHTRFTDTNVEIQRIADVVLTLQTADATDSRVGGTNELAAMAARHHKPVYALSVSFDAQGEATLSGALNMPRDFEAPCLPEALHGKVLTQQGFVADIKSACSNDADVHQKRFDRHTRIVIWTHVYATAFAAAALALSYAHAHAQYSALGLLYPSVPLLLLIELVLLSWGLRTHQRLHKDETTHQWAGARLIAEIARSAQTLGAQIDRLDVPDPAHPGQSIRIEQPFPGQHTHLKHLFEVPLPPEFQHLASTLNVLHLKATRPLRDADWRGLRERYVRERLDTTVTRNRGQIPYYQGNLAEAQAAIERAHRWFMRYALGAIAATFVKLGATSLGLHIAGAAEVMSWLAIVLPVLAVAVMSLTANLDKAARASNFKEMLTFLQRQRELLRKAESASEFLRLQAETEARLLGETVNWYYRRRFVNPA